MRNLLSPMDGEPDLDAVYAFPALAGDERYVRGNFVTSLDGAIEVGGRSGPLGGPGDSRVFSLLRELADVVLVGAGTARHEDYGPVRLSASRRRSRAAEGRAEVPPVAVVTRHGLRATSRLLEPVDGSPPPLVLTTSAALAAAPAEVRDRAEHVACGDSDVDLRLALDALVARGLRRITCEGGPGLLTDLLVAGLLDELCLTVSPQLAGPGRAGMTAGPEWSDTVPLVLGSALEQDGELYLRYPRPR